MQTADFFTVKEVSGDKAYSSRANLELINDVGAVPYIPFKKGTTGERRTLHVEEDVPLLRVQE